jgi:hypothetical protein
MERTNVLTELSADERKKLLSLKDFLYERFEQDDLKKYAIKFYLEENKKHITLGFFCESVKIVLLEFNFYISETSDVLSNFNIKNWIDAFECYQFIGGGNYVEEKDVFLRPGVIDVPLKPISDDHELDSVSEIVFEGVNEKIYISQMKELSFLQFLSSKNYSVYFKIFYDFYMVRII